MPSPTSASNVGAISPSVNQNIEALLGSYRWSGSTITYSYPGYDSVWSTNPISGYGSSASGNEPWSASFAPLSTIDQLYFSEALARWSDVAILNFLQVDDSVTNVGDIRAAYSFTEANENSQAWSYPPSFSASAGDLWFNMFSSSSTTVWNHGTYSYMTTLHELGHSLGLKHPFDGISVLPSSIDSRTYTIMSYSAQPGVNSTYFNFEPTTPMLLDVQAIQYIYGANYDFNAGNTSFDYVDSTYYHQTIWDGGGIDTIRYTGHRNSTLDLRQGYGSQIGMPVYVKSAFGVNLYPVNNVWIAYGVTIENAEGGYGDDVITGNDVNNCLVGGGGNDTLNGGAGIDTASYTGNRSAYTIIPVFTGFSVSGGSDGTDILSNIERLNFNDKKIALDMAIDQSGGEAALLIGALLGPSRLSDGVLVGLLINYFDEGNTLRDAATVLVDTGEVDRLAGGSSTNAFVNLMFRCVVGQEPTEIQTSSLAGLIDGGSYSRIDFLTTVAGLGENQSHIGLSGLAMTGLEFV